MNGLLPAAFTKDLISAVVFAFIGSPRTVS